MPDQALVKASLLRLFPDGEQSDGGQSAGGRLDAAFADEVASSDNSSRVDAVLKDKMPRELFELPFGQTIDRIDIGSHYQISKILREMWQAEKAINDRAAALGWVGNATSAFTASQADGYVRHFANASIYWTRAFGAKEVHGAIRDRYFLMGAELSYLGFPQTDELSAMSNGDEVRYSNFQGGTILWTSHRGAFMNPSFSPITERHQLGAWLYMVGQGFTPGGRVSFWIVNAPNAPQVMNSGPAFAATDGRIGSNPASRPVADLRNRGGDHAPSVARALDEATGQEAFYPLSYALY